MEKHHVKGLLDFLKRLSVWFPEKPVVEKTKGSLDILIINKANVPIQFIYAEKYGGVPDLDTGISYTLKTPDENYPFSVLVGFDTETESIFVRQNLPAENPVNPTLYAGELPIERFWVCPDGSFVPINIETIVNTDHTHTLNSLSEKSYNSLTDKPVLPSVEYKKINLLQGENKFIISDRQRALFIQFYIENISTIKNYEAGRITIIDYDTEALVTVEHISKNTEISNNLKFSANLLTNQIELVMDVLLLDGELSFFYKVK